MQHTLCGMLVCCLVLTQAGPQHGPATQPAAAGGLGDGSPALGGRGGQGTYVPGVHSALKPAAGRGTWLGARAGVLQVSPARQQAALVPARARCMHDAAD